MLIFEAIDAGHGDAILVRYQGTGGFERILLIDGGPKSAKTVKGGRYVPYETRVVPRLMEIKKERDAKARSADIRAGEDKLTLDLVVCTHIDDDHIAGIERLYGCLAGGTKCAKDGEKIEAPNLWFNSFSALLGDKVNIAAALAEEAPDALAASVNQGENLTAFATRVQGVEVNAGAPGTLIAGRQTPRGFKPATLTILNPGGKALENLRKDWLEAIAKKKPKAGQTAGLDAEAFKGDQAVANLSSIVILVEWFGRKILLTGDQRGDHVHEALIDAGKMQSGGRFHVDIMKVPHHGAKANVPKSFIEAVTADVYVFCANGRDQNPDPPVLEIVANEARKGRKFTMAFTNGDMAYDEDKTGAFGKIGGTVVKTLKEAIAEMCEDPAINANVTFAFRDPGAHSFCCPLDKVV